MYKKQLLFLLLFSFSTIYAQDFLSNNSGLVSIKDGAFLSVEGDIFIENNGVFDNSDSIFFTNDWFNNAGNTGFSSIGEGYVYLIGDDQRIGGADETHFHNLLLRNTGIKYGDLDVYVDSLLDLAFLEFNMDINVVYVNNPVPSVVVNSDGFVSSLENGGISRVTNQNTDYLFPVGSSTFGTIYRPLEVTTTNAPQIYRARFADMDATFDGYDRDERALLICDINENYYHRLWQDMGSDSVAIRFFYDAAVDGLQWNDIVHWQNVPEWQQAPADAQSTLGTWDLLDVLSWNDFSTPNFALAFTKPSFANAGNDTTIYLLDTIQLNATGGTFYTWEPAYPISCTDCADPLFWHDSTTTIWVLVEDDDNCKDIDTITVTVDDRYIAGEGPFIPSGISPNGDGVNDYWYIRWLYKYPDNEVIILNRWEDVVFKTDDYQNDWFGTYNGKELPEGTYYYILRIYENGEQTQNYTGPITILE
jgi:gliding motility-associated-like protein